MKWKNSFKKGSLAAFVTLALTGSALAMPTGGTVENGSVNVDAANFGANDAIANVANGATITPQTNSIINWEAFNIAQGEALHFNTTNAALLNRVTGAQMSELLGQMTQVGGNFLYLVNPNGIHIGGTASFDVSNLTLSTLNVASEDFLSYVTAAKPYLPSQQDAAKGAKTITVDQGAHFNAAGPLMLQASKVTVADGVTFVATPSPMPHAFYITAAKSNSGSDNTTKTEAGNDVVFRGEAKNFDIISMLGSNITLDGAKLAGKNINMNAVGTFTMNPIVSEDSYTMTAAPTNTLTVKNTQIAGDEVELLGGKVDVADDVKFGFDAGSNEAHLMVAAVKSYSKNNKDNKETMEVSTVQGNDVAFHGMVTSDADRDAEVNIGGATVNMDGAKFRMPKGNLSVVAIASSEDSYAEDAGVEKETALTKATAANVVQADGLDVEGNLHGTQIYGGKVELKNTTIKTPGKIEIEAYTSRDWKHEERTTAHANELKSEKTLYAGKDNAVRLENTRLLNENSDPSWFSRLWIRGGKIEMNNSELASESEVNALAFHSLHERREKPMAESYVHTKEFQMQANAENTVDISSTKIHANRASWDTHEKPDVYADVAGGKVSLTNVEIKAPRDISVSALREMNSEETADGDKGEIKSDTSNVLDMRGATIEAGGVAEIWGGKTQMKASSVQAGKIDIAAANETRTAYPFREIYPTAETSNTLYLEDVKLKSQANAMDYSDYAGDADLQGGQVALKKTEIDAARASIHSGQMKQGDDGKFYLTKGTTLHMDSTKIETPSYMSRSGAVNLVNGSEIKAKEAFFVAAESYDDSTGKATVTKDTNLSLWRSKVEADDLDLMTGGLNAWKTSEVKSQKPMNEYAADLVRKDGSSFTMQRDEGSHIIEGGVEIAAPRVSVVTSPKEPSSPLFPLTPDNAQLSEQDKENIAAGKSEAQDIIASAADTEAQGKALAEAVGKINNVPNASSRQKAGVVTGMIQAINEMNTLTTEEKHALQVAVLDAYGAVQEAKTEGSNRTQQANGDAMRLTTMESAAANMPTAEEPQDAVHFAG
ncbi:filamentous hemagglutinin N-terminal domain-containing protein [Selenomonas sputigena]|uniref:two-partner secretion domain-containing protein n=1 Tax=Selenomonas sputigena TaxID=69823 RepID=UPI0022341897|nr:filamentous hemagglutinin N-terminal domain-containing protein [Selenomonas sputigena]UZE46153.1 filamentous hemagglutinin N-terminal domain-containing protein [Selenomonas sputigena]